MEWRRTNEAQQQSSDSSGDVRWKTWSKSAVIVVYFVVATVIVPSAVIEASFMASPPSWYADLISASTWSLVRDVIGTGVWAAALVGGLWALRQAQRRQLI